MTSGETLFGYPIEELEQGGEFRRIDGEWKFFPDDRERRPALKRGELDSRLIRKWWPHPNDGPLREKAIGYAAGNEEVWDAYTLPLDDPFFDKFRALPDDPMPDDPEELMQWVYEGLRILGRD